MCNIMKKCSGHYYRKIKGKRVKVKCPKKRARSVKTVGKSILGVTSKLSGKLKQSSVVLERGATVIKATREFADAVEELRQ